MVTGFKHERTGSKVDTRSILNTVWCYLDDRRHDVFMLCEGCSWVLFFRPCTFFASAAYSSPFQQGLYDERSFHTEGLVHDCYRRCTRRQHDALRAVFLFNFTVYTGAQLNRITQSHTQPGIKFSIMLWWAFCWNGSARLVPLKHTFT